MTRTKTRTHRHPLWLTQAEKSQWSEKAILAGLSLNEYIRACVERRKIPERQPQINRQVATELGRIGVNLNQQVRAMNTALASGQFIPNVDESLATIQELYEVVKQLQLQILR
jgi:hypothetical protein